MKCQRCQGCMARDYFLDIQESGGEWWAKGWRCINCGNVYDPVAEQNRRRHAEAMLATSQMVLESQEEEAFGMEEESFDIAA